jgi:nicotinamidase-related amidase
LAAWLTFIGVDTLFITGCTTFGCVRASTKELKQNASIQQEWLQV